MFCRQSPLQYILINNGDGEYAAFREMNGEKKKAKRHNEAQISSPLIIKF